MGTPDSRAGRAGLRDRAGPGPDRGAVWPVRRPRDAVAPPPGPRDPRVGLGTAVRRPDVYPPGHAVGRSIVGLRRPAGRGGRRPGLVGGRRPDGGGAGRALCGDRAGPDPGRDLADGRHGRGAAGGGDWLDPLPGPAAPLHLRLRLPDAPGLPAAARARRLGRLPGSPLHDDPGEPARRLRRPADDRRRGRVRPSDLRGLGCVSVARGAEVRRGGGALRPVGPGEPVRRRSVRPRVQAADLERRHQHDHRVSAGPVRPGRGRDPGVGPAGIDRPAGGHVAADRPLPVGSRAGVAAPGARRRSATRRSSPSRWRRRWPR